MSLDQRVDDLIKRVTKLQSQIELALEGVEREVRKERSQINS